MTHHLTHRRNLAPEPPQVSNPITDLNGKRHPKKNTTVAAATAVYKLTNHFLRLSKPQNTHLQVKPLSKSVNFEPSVSRINVNQEKRVVLETDKKGGNEVIKPTATTIEEMGLNLNLNLKIGRRRSFCDSKVELGNFLITNSAKMVSVDMPPSMQIHAVGFTRKVKDSLEKFTSRSLALSLKKEFDGSYGPAWHCIVGTSYGSFVTHTMGGFLYFCMDQKIYVLLFKTSVQKAVIGCK